MNSPSCSGGSDPEKIESPCGSGVGSGEPGFVDNCSSSCNSFPFIFDAKSVAWGSCGDTYNRHKDPLFRELLFVSGNHGVTVHAFCCTKDLSDKAKGKPNGELRHGEWVEWGPSRLSQKSEPERVSSSYGSKQWMQSFLIDLETTVIDGTRQSRFPEKSAFPGSAEVVSFSILNTDLPFSNLLFQDNSILPKDNMPEDGNVNITVYNIIGQVVKELVNEYRRAGYYDVMFNANNLSSGLYIYRITSGKFNTTMKMLLLK